MPLVFSYGTLQEAEVQLSTFGRLLQGHTDELPGFTPALVKIKDPVVVLATGKTHYANAAYTGSIDSCVSGTAFEITDAELAAADEFERPANYKRIAVTLRSGKRAWVYVEASSAPAKPDQADL